MSKNRYAFGIKVLKEATVGTFIAPTKPLCIQADSDRDDVNYKTKECNISSSTMGGSYEIVLDAKNPKSTIPIKQPLPLVLGGLEDVILADRLKKTTETAPDRAEYTFDSANESSVSVEVTSLRKVSQHRGGTVDFKISGEVNDYVVFDATISATRSGLVESAEGDADNVLPALIVDGGTDVFYFSCDNPVLINGVDKNMVKSFEFALNPEMAEGENDTECKTSAIVDFKPTLSLTADLTNSLKFKTSDMIKGAAFNIKIPFSNNLGVEKGYLLLPKAVLNADPKVSNNSGLEEVTATYSCRKTVGDDNFIFVIYA